MATVKLIGYQCERCAHQWLPRDAEQEPRVCPKCKSPYWNRPRHASISGNAKRKKSNGK